MPFYSRRTLTIWDRVNLNPVASQYQPADSSGKPAGTSGTYRASAFYNKTTAINYTRYFTITLRKNTNVASISLTYIDENGNSQTTTSAGTYYANPNSAYSWSATAASGYTMSQSSGSGNVTTSFTISPTATAAGSWHTIFSGSQKVTTSGANISVNITARTSYKYRMTVVTGGTNPQTYTSSESIGYAQLNIEGNMGTAQRPQFYNAEIEVDAQNSTTMHATRAEKETFPFAGTTFITLIEAYY